MFASEDAGLVVLITGYPQPVLTQPDTVSCDNRLVVVQVLANSHGCVQRVGRPNPGQQTRDCGGRALDPGRERAVYGVEIERTRIEYGELPRLQAGNRLRDGYNELAASAGLSGVTQCKGHGARTLTTFGADGHDPLVLKSLVQQDLIRDGILWTGFHTMCYAHTDADVDYTLEAYERALGALAAALDGDSSDALRGGPIEPVFRAATGFHTKPKDDR